MYRKAKTKDRTVIASKGGHVEQDLMPKLIVLCVNLEHYGHYCRSASCGFHMDDAIHHCPLAECHAFWLLQNTNV